MIVWAGSLLRQAAGLQDLHHPIPSRMGRRQEDQSARLAQSAKGVETIDVLDHLHRQHRVEAQRVRGVARVVRHEQGGGARDASELPAVCRSQARRNLADSPSCAASVGASAGEVDRRTVVGGGCDSWRKSSS